MSTATSGIVLRRARGGAPSEARCRRCGDSKAGPWPKINRWADAHYGECTRGDRSGVRVRATDGRPGWFTAVCMDCGQGATRTLWGVQDWGEKHRCPTATTASLRVAPVGTPPPSTD